MKGTDNGIDFGRTGITRLFISLLLPTIAAMICNSLLNIADGIIVGKGIGSDALAAVNISAPLYVITSAIALMFASGVSIVASVLMSEGKIMEADVCITRAMFLPAAVMAAISLFMLTCTEQLNLLFGGSERLYPYVRDYVKWLTPMPVVFYVLTVGTFVLRLDGAPRMAMYVNIVPAFLNMVLDWFFVFPLESGIKGAAIATVTSGTVGIAMVLIYLTGHSRTLTICRIRTGAVITVKDLRHMARLGMPTFIAEGAMCFMIIMGNHMFMERLHEEGVAAFSVACYMFPLIFMFGNAISQSQMPIISYNRGLGDSRRVRRTIRLAVAAGFVTGLAITAAGILGNRWLLVLFLDSGSEAYRIASGGFPLFSIGFLFITLNMVLIGYFQSMARSWTATAFTLSRGVIILIPMFLLLPSLVGDDGLWLATPAAEAATFLAITVYYLTKKRRQ